MTDPIRLAHFIDSFEVGGSELNAIRTLEALSPGRVDVTVFHLGSGGPLLQRYLALRVPMVHVRLGGGFWHPAAIKAGVKLASQLRRRRIQVLHSHDIYSNIFSVPWARFAGGVVTVASKRWHQAVPSVWHRMANRVASRLATAVLANSRAVSRSLVEEEGIPADRIRIVPNFLEAAAFERTGRAERDAWRQELGLPPQAVVVGVVARLHRVKGHDTLLRALPPLIRDFPALHLLLVGEGAERPRIEQLAAQLGLAGRVRFVGQLPNRPNPHQLLDISVLPSLTEGFPNAVIEAMAVGVPVVACAVGGVPDAVVHGETGLLVPPGKPEDLESALRRLLTDTGMPLAMGVAGRLRARELYHEDRVIPELVGWYEALAAGHGAR